MMWRIFALMVQKRVVVIEVPGNAYNGSSDAWGPCIYYHPSTLVFNGQAMPSAVQCFENPLDAPTNAYWPAEAFESDTFVVMKRGCHYWPAYIQKATRIRGELSTAQSKSTLPVRFWPKQVLSTDPVRRA